MLKSRGSGIGGLPIFFVFGKSRLLSYNDAMYKPLIDNARIMAGAAAAGIGPDVVIIVNSSEDQAVFWQNRLTGEDNVHSAGTVLKTGAVILSVTESNWSGGAGNGLGTLNGFEQAARKAKKLGVTDPGFSFMTYCRGKSVFMFHTAGKGTRVQPLPAVECNSKSNIKLAGTVEVEGAPEVITILEAVLIETAIYAPSRKNRLSVFWGDQIIINENNVNFNGKHHIEIFGKPVTLDEDIESYGILIRAEQTDAKQREKLSMEEVKQLIPREGERVMRSIGSFTVSLSFFDALLKESSHVEALTKAEGSFNTDPDWWQPLTSERGEYIDMMCKKGVNAEDAGAQWDKMQNLWKTFFSSEECKTSGLTRLLGATDVGKNSYWWDYGRNACYLKNIRILAEDSPEGETARIFFGVTEEEYIGRSAIDPDLFGGTVSITDSVIRNSRVKRGKLNNCVVIDSYLEEVCAEDSVIVGSTVLKLNAKGAVCYTVVSEKEDIAEGEILANIFHPENGRIVMRTDISRNGREDWDKNVYVYDNAYTYGELAALMDGVKEKDVKAFKKDVVREIKR